MPKELNLKQSLLKELLDDSMTKSEVEKIITSLAEKIKAIDERNIKDLDMMSKALSEASKKLKNDTSSDFNGLKQQTLQSIEKKLVEGDFKLNNKIKELDERISQIKDGEDADPNFVRDLVLESITIPTIDELKNDIPSLAERIRDALELLQGEERLDVSAIKGLKDYILENAPKNLAGAVGAVNAEIRLVDDETPTGLVNGTNKVFTLSLTPSPVASLKIYKDGQRMKVTEDYTLSGNTITFVNAPLTDSIITCDYRIM